MKNFFLTIRTRVTGKADGTGKTVNRQTNFMLIISRRIYHKNTQSTKYSSLRSSCLSGQNLLRYNKLNLTLL
jgi:hypothetical protein